MDEPTVGLDPASRRDLLRFIVRMCKERSISVLWATHLCDEVADGDRVIVLHRGRVLNDSKPNEFVSATGAGYPPFIWLG
jgi:ABC-2 type transport system ATP-binding protein